tara:strand:+ start:312 stop:779 length:468 start_codon:yes stop_codon:yes gene_type:complete
MNNMYRNGPAKLHDFGKGDFEDFKVTDLKSVHLKNIKKMFPRQYISYEKLSDYVFKLLEEDNDMLIGDIIYIATSYTTRPYYGFGIVYFDEDKNKKSISFDEGQPYIKYKHQIRKLWENNVTYNNIKTYAKQMPSFPYWNEWKETWVDKGLFYLI